jgi:hypothetical protein
MTFKEFKDSLRNTQPPAGLNNLLQALWYDAKGDWNAAHQIAQETSTREGSWIHAFLHRKEGDLSNASYWYHQAGEVMPSNPLEEEWGSIVRKFLE